MLASVFASTFGGIAAATAVMLIEDESAGQQRSGSRPQRGLPPRRGFVPARAPSQARRH
jgi:hypothetical protein